MNTQDSKLLQPLGAYTELKDLWALRHIASLKLKVSQQSTAVISGRHRSRALSRGMEFEEVRVYQAGDDIRNIDWRVTARTQQPHTKRYQDEKEKPVFTLVDQRQSLFFGSEHCFKSVYACHLAALINWQTVAKGDRAGGLVISTDHISDSRATRNTKGLNHWFSQLISANHLLNGGLINSEPTISDALKQLNQVAHNGAEIILISDGYDFDNSCDEWLFRLCRNHRIKFFWLYDALEKRMPQIDNLKLTDGEHNHTLSISKKDQFSQEQRFLKKAKTLENRCLRFGIEFIPAAINQPLNNTLLGFQPRLSHG